MFCLGSALYWLESASSSSESLKELLHGNFSGGPVVENPSASAGDQVRYLVKEDPTYHATEQLGLSTTATKPTL